MSRMERTRMLFKLYVQLGRHLLVVRRHWRYPKIRDTFLLSFGGCIRVCIGLYRAYIGFRPMVSKD